MDDSNNQRVPPEGEKTQEQAPASSTADNAQEQRTEAPSQAQDKFQGKTEQELIEMYREAERKLGEQSKEVHDARQKAQAFAEQEKNMQVLLNAVYADPKNVELVTSMINKYLGAETTDSSESGDGPERKSQKATSDDTRRTLQNLVIADFYKRHGIQGLSPEDRKAEESKIASSFAELLDPGGKKPMKQLLDEIPLDRLDRYLEKAYRDSHYDELVNKAKSEGLLSAEENRQASIGSLSSSAGDRGGITLTPEEKQVADKLGISHEDYAKSKPRK